MGYIRTSRVGQEESAVVESSAKAMLRSLSALANKHCAYEAGNSSTDGLGRKGVSTKGGTETEEAIGGGLMQETVVEG